MSVKELIGLALTDTNLREKLLKNPEKLFQEYSVDVDSKLLNKVKLLTQEMMNGISVGAGNDFSRLVLIDRR